MRSWNACCEAHKCICQSDRLPVQLTGEVCGQGKAGSGSPPLGCGYHHLSSWIPQRSRRRIGPSQTLRRKGPAGCPQNWHSGRRLWMDRWMNECGDWTNDGEEVNCLVNEWEWVSNCIWKYYEDFTPKIPFKDSTTANHDNHEYLR